MSEIGKRIKWLREQKKWSQVQLAEKLGIHNSVLSRIESGEKKGVDHQLVSEVADLFDVSTDFLHGKTDNPTPFWKNASIREKPTAFFDVQGLGEQEMEEVKRHIEYLKWKAKQKK